MARNIHIHVGTKDASLSDLRKEYSQAREKLKNDLDDFNNKVEAYNRKVQKIIDASMKQGSEGESYYFANEVRRNQVLP